jgi:hypothetical protein
MLWLLIAGCAAPGRTEEPSAPLVAIDGLTIRNELDYPVTEVMVLVPATGAFAGCGTILPHSECSNRFQQLDYRANAIRISWREHGREQSTGAFVVEVPPQLVPGQPARVEVIVFSPGEAGARLVQP